MTEQAFIALLLDKVKNLHDDVAEVYSAGMTLGPEEQGSVMAALEEAHTCIHAARDRLVRQHPELQQVWGPPKKTRQIN